MNNRKYVIGLDFGTNSVRSLIVSTDNGEEIASYVYNYKYGDYGIITDSKDHNVARQHPKDYIAGIKSIKKAVNIAKAQKEFNPYNIIAIGVDTTGSTPIPVDEKGIPLIFDKEFKNNLNALAWLWKDHSSFQEAEEITSLAEKKYPEYLKKCGGKYSSEWFFSKILHCLRKDPKVFDKAFSWVELADFIPAYLTGNLHPLQLKRSICAAGHKAMFNYKWQGLPCKEFLIKLHPKLGNLRDRLYTQAYTADTKAGELTKELAQKLELKPGIPVSVGAFDAHMGAVGAGIKPGILVKIIGTSTCDMMIVSNKKTLQDIPGLCGIVDGSIIPGYFGLEAGQSAVGDIFNWFVQNFTPYSYYQEARKNKVDIHQIFTEKAKTLKTGKTGLLALDWHNGNRTILTDAQLSGLLIGQTLQTKPHEIYKTLIEATAFGARMIINQFEKYNIKIKEVINCGGIAEKNPFLMQIYADVLDRPMKLSKSSQTCALGAAIFAAVVAGKTSGGYNNVEEAQRAMTHLKEKVFIPIQKNKKIYTQLFELYQKLHDSFGTKNFIQSHYHIMKDLIKIKEKIGK